ncbi:hypothetical protein BGW41_007434 [Actinomortierella wolfii]|nr:hypothetical protein BGW41_007434 [Actinomortierella wolfii]
MRSSWMHPSAAANTAAAQPNDNHPCGNLLVRNDQAELPTPLDAPLLPSSPTATSTLPIDEDDFTPSPSSTLDSTNLTTDVQSKTPPLHATVANGSVAPVSDETQDDLLQGIPDGEEQEPCHISPRRNSRLQYASSLVNTNRLSSLLHLRGSMFGSHGSGGARQATSGIAEKTSTGDMSNCSDNRRHHHPTTLPTFAVSNTHEDSSPDAPIASSPHTVGERDRSRFSLTVQGTATCMTSPTVPSVSLSAHSSSMATTFYSGVKLAPPIVSAHVSGLEKRTSDQRVWYTIQVQPCDLLVPVMSSSTSSTSSSESATTTAIPRKPYNIYRRYEDVAEFADQLEDEFPSLGSFQVPASDQGALERSKPLELPRLANRLVLFVTKTVCQQRKEDLDRYLQELFALGPILSQLRLVSEFFGIWKTDMEVHLSLKDGDPLALQHHQLHLQQTQQQQQQPPSAVVSSSSTAASLATAFLPISPSSSSSSSSSSSLLSPSAFMDTPSTMSQPSGMSTSGPPQNTNSSTPPSAPLSFPPLPSLPLPPPAKDWETMALASNGLLTPHPEDHSPSVEMPSSNSIGHNGSLERRRTFKKLKAFQFSESTTGTGNSRHEEMAISPLCTPTEEKSDPTLSYTNLQPMAPGASPNFSTTATNDIVTTAPLSLKPKVMKRAKTIVFRPEVTVQPLASRHVIPPWNRIPTTSAAGTPLSPVSPPPGGIPASGSPLSFPLPGGHYNDQAESTGAPRKLSLTPSKTTASISTAGMEPLRRSPSPNLAATAGSRNAAMHSNNSNGSTRSLPTTTVQSTTMPQLIAPWNRQSSSSETSTHLHSLIRISSSASPNSQMLENKNGAAVLSGASTNGTKPRSILKNSNPQPYSTMQVTTTPMTRTRTSPAKCHHTNSMPRKGITHSTSAPSGTMPTLLFSETPSSVPSNATNTRTKQKREMMTGPGGKPIVGILKNASSFHPPHHQYQQYLSPCSARRASQDAVHDIGAGPNGTAIATTFKIVVDADTIVALQVLEEPDFVLSLQELRQRIKSKLQKSNIVLHEDFELAWVPMNNGSQSTQCQQQQSGSTLALKKKAVPLETDEDLFQAMLASPSRKVTLRCNR